MEEVLAAAAAVLLLLLPGGLIAGAFGLRGLWWVAAAPVATIALVGGIGILAAPIRLPFAWWEPLVAAIVIAAIVTIARRRRGTWSHRVGRWTRGEAALVVVVAAAGIATSVIGVLAIGGPDRISQTYDGVFHLNAVAWILDTGDASSFDLYRITHPGTGNQFYPAAWHALTASTAQSVGASIPLATTATWAATTAALWAPGIALLTAVVAPHRHRRIAAGVAAVASVGFVGFPLLLLAWGTLYPTALAYALLPFGVAITVRVVAWARLRIRDGRIPVPSALIAMSGLWLVASATAHPRSLFSWAVVCAPLLLGTAAGVIRHFWRIPRLRPRIVAILAVVVGIVVLGTFAALVVLARFYDLSSRPIADHLNGGPAVADQSLGTALVQGLFGGPESPVGGSTLSPAVVMSLLAICGVVVCAIRRGTRWIVIAWILSLALYTLAAGSNSDLSKVMTAIWYKDKFRLLAILPVIQGPAVGLFTAAVIALVRARTAVVRILAAAAAFVIVGVGVATSGVIGSGTSAVAQAFRMPAHHKDGALLDGDEDALLRRLPTEVPRSAVILGDPWDGSALSWAIGGRRTLFPHLAGDWSPDALLVAGALDRITTDPAVCAAAHRLGLQWVVEDPELLWGNPAEAAPFAGIHRAARAGILTPVDHVGSAGLYRLPECRS